MSYGLPAHGDLDWDDDVNNSVEAIYALAQSADSNADSARDTALTALNIAQAVNEFVAVPTDEQIATKIEEDGSATQTALTASYVVFRDQNGDPLPPGSVTTITVNTVTGEIDDITFQEA